jgi:hypothetical protein
VKDHTTSRHLAEPLNLAGGVIVLEVREESLSWPRGRDDPSGGGSFLNAARTMTETRSFYAFAWPSAGLWRHTDFLKFWSAQAISALGSRITRTALPILAVLTIHASARQIAILSALSIAPGVVVGLVLGGRVDRRAKRPLLIGADLLRAGLLLTVPLSAWLGHLGIVQL